MPSKRLVSDFTSSIAPSKSFEMPEKGFNLFIIPIVIFVLFGVYHSYYIYQDEQVQLKKLQEKGKNCLLEFKVQQCNPMSLTDQCAKLAQCFQSADNTDGAMGLTLQLAQKTSRSLSDTLVGPIMIILLTLAIGHLKKKL